MTLKDPINIGWLKRIKDRSQDEKITALLNLALDFSSFDHSMYPKQEKQKMAITVLLTRFEKPNTPEKSKILSNALVEVAGKNLSSAKFLADAFPNPIDFEQTDFQIDRIEALVTILRNNPALNKDESSMKKLRTKANEIRALYTYDDFCKQVAKVEDKHNHEYNPTKLTDSFFAKLAELHGEIGGAESVVVLAEWFMKKGIAVSESIASLGKIGHHCPGLAVLALKKIKKDPKYSEKAEEARNRIVCSLTSSNNFYATTNNSSDFADVLTQSLKKIGYGDSDIRRLKRKIKSHNIICLHEAAMMTVDQVGRFGHPLMNKTLMRFLGAIQNMPTPKDERVWPAVTRTAKVAC